MKKVLFLGDSITDKNLNSSYPFMAEGELGVRYPNTYECMNTGISGNRVVDLLARVKRDVINLEPDYLSILIGVNDAWHDFSESPNGVCAERYLQIYDYLIEQIKEALPNIKIMILEPFTLKGTANEDNYDIFRAEVEKRAEAAKEVANKHGLEFVELQSCFDKAIELAPASFWLRDGVHPTHSGHKLISDKWVAGFENIKAE